MTHPSAAILFLAGIGAGFLLSVACGSNGNSAQADRLAPTAPVRATVRTPATTRCPSWFATLRMAIAPTCSSTMAFTIFSRAGDRGGRPFTSRFEPVRRDLLRLTCGVTPCRGGR